MVALVETLRLAGYALGAFGGVLVFVEFFQVPSYVEYDETMGWNITLSPQEVKQHTALGRVGAIGIALGFALLFVAELLG